MLHLYDSTVRYYVQSGCTHPRYVGEGTEALLRAQKIRSSAWNNGLTVRILKTAGPGGPYVAVDK